ncbi:hypothetical protein E2562_038403 [Oryza meyeriana var. granulata]|uniref:Uncharacterized protein n=1 Tax=Oryza meyeriana var. granulata TaxID=110450 RepID=A0A6G1EAT3_9ORYZ|nr:hypothetical protein E2562_038403 [Oryza meyeriana var. granulata]
MDNPRKRMSTLGVMQDHVTVCQVWWPPRHYVLARVGERQGKVMGPYVCLKVSDLRGYAPGLIGAHHRIKLSRAWTGLEASIATLKTSGLKYRVLGGYP